MRLTSKLQVLRLASVCRLLSCLSDRASQLAPLLRPSLLISPGSPWPVKEVHVVTLPKALFGLAKRLQIAISGWLEL